MELTCQFELTVIQVSPQRELCEWLNILLKNTCCRLTQNHLHLQESPALDDVLDVLSDPTHRSMLQSLSSVRRNISEVATPPEISSRGVKHPEETHVRRSEPRRIAEQISNRCGSRIEKGIVAPRGHKRSSKRTCRGKVNVTR